MCGQQRRSAASRGEHAASLSNKLADQRLFIGRGGNKGFGKDKHGSPRMFRQVRRRTGPSLGAIPELTEQHVSGFGAACPGPVA